MWLDRLPLLGRIVVVSVLWLLLISLGHYYLNTEHSKRKIITMGYMPVITNLAAPLLDYASKDTSGVRYKAVKFSSFAEMAESLRNGQLDVAFMIAPLSIVLRQQGDDVKVVYIGNRHESTLVARKDINAKSLQDLRGKTIAVPMRFSGHNLSLRRMLDEQGLQGEVNIVEMNPPDMASALSSGALDAYYVGEPFAAQTLSSGDASLLMHVEDEWNGFICNLAVVKKTLIDEEPDLVQQLVSGAARSGEWASRNTSEAAKIASSYWNQPDELVRYALSTPENRIVYDQYSPIEEEMDKIARLMQKYGLTESTDISGLVASGFAKKASMSDITSSIESILNE